MPSSCLRPQVEADHAARVTCPLSVLPNGIACSSDLGFGIITRSPVTPSVEQIPSGIIVRGRIPSPDSCHALQVQLETFTHPMRHSIA